MDESQDDEWLRPFEAAKVLGIGRTTAYRHVDQWERDGVRVLRIGPRTILIDKVSLLAWQSRQEVQPPLKSPGRKRGGWRERLHGRTERDDKR